MTEAPASRLLTLTTAGPDETRAVAAAVAERLQAGDVVTLTGELGAGKTTFVQGAAAALGVEGRVTSPTFTLVRSYRPRDRRFEVVHVDVYRLDRLQDIVELGEETILGPGQVTFIEWGDTVEALLPTDRLDVEILLGDGDEQRRVLLRGQGRFAQRLTAMQTDLMAWLDGGGRG